MKTMLTVGALCLASTVTHAALDDYQLRRLPASLGKQFEDANGNLRVILPSFISNSGIMGGIRMTWERPEDELGTPLPGVTRLVNHSGYLYDLNTRTYIAQHIAGQIVSYVGDDYYLSKRLHPNLQRWQTRRCPISGLVQRPDSTVYDNPDCVLIDNDFLNQTPAQGTLDAYWASQFITINMLSSAGFGYGSTNTASSSLVWDLDDNYPNYDTDEYNLYRLNGQKIAIDEAFYTAAGVPTVNEFGSVVAFGMSDGKDTAWGGIHTDGSTPATVYQVQLQEDGSPQTTSIQINQVIGVDADTGNNIYADVYGISKSGLIATAAGTCSFASGCTDTTYFDTPVQFTATSPLLLNNKLWVGANLPALPSGVYVIDMRGSQPEAVDIAALVLDKFGEVPASSGAYTFPQTTEFNGSMSANISVSESGDHLVLATQLDNGAYRLYYLRKQ